MRGIGRVVGGFCTALAGLGVKVRADPEGQCGHSGGAVKRE
jgi:hypothetical protein